MKSIAKVVKREMPTLLYTFSAVLISTY